MGNNLDEVCGVHNRVAAFDTRVPISTWQPASRIAAPSSSEHVPQGGLVKCRPDCRTRVLPPMRLAPTRARRAIYSHASAAADQEEASCERRGEKRKARRRPVSQVIAMRPRFVRSSVPGTVGVCALPARTVLQPTPRAAPSLAGMMILLDFGLFFKNLVPCCSIMLCQRSMAPYSALIRYALPLALCAHVPCGNSIHTALCKSRPIRPRLADTAWPVRPATQLPPHLGQVVLGERAHTAQLAT